MLPKEEALLQRDTESFGGQAVEYEIPVSVYPTDTGTIIINSPGSGELKDGRHNRWANLARHLQEGAVGSMVLYNVPRPDAQFQYPTEPYTYRGCSWNRILVEALCHVIEHALEQSQQLCGSPSPRIYLSGFSSGGSAVGAVAFRYPQIEKLLMLSTYDSVGDYFYGGLPQFTGDIYMAYGSDDPLAAFLAYVVSHGELAARSLSVRQVDNCDHRFSGAANGRILSKAFLWAFAGDQSFPDPEGGISIYDE